MVMEDMDDIIPEFEARYDSSFVDDSADTENWMRKILPAGSLIFKSPEHTRSCESSLMQAQEEMHILLS